MHRGTEVEADVGVINIVVVYLPTYISIHHTRVEFLVP